jgi:hypothetical protein
VEDPEYQAKGAREVANPNAPERRPTDLNWRGRGNLWRARYLPDSEKSANVRPVLLLCAATTALDNGVWFWGRKAGGLRGRCIGPTTADDPSKTAWRNTRCWYREVACSFYRQLVPVCTATAPVGQSGPGDPPYSRTNVF